MKFALTFFILISSACRVFAAGPNETLYTILFLSGFTVTTAAPIDTIVVNDVYCEEKSAKKVKCVASQNQVREIVNPDLFLNALRGGAKADCRAKGKKVYQLSKLQCSARAISNGSFFFSCLITP